MESISRSEPGAWCRVVRVFALLRAGFAVMAFVVTGFAVTGFAVTAFGVGVTAGAAGTAPALAIAAESPRAAGLAVGAPPAFLPAADTPPAGGPSPETSFGTTAPWATTSWTTAPWATEPRATEPRATTSWATAPRAIAPELAIALSAPSAAADSWRGDAWARPQPRLSWPLSPDPVVTKYFDAPETPYGPGHRGVDLAAVPGQEVLAADAGVVVFAGLVGGRPVVSVDHDGGLRTTYQPVAAEVAAGDQVYRRQVLGTVVAGHPGCAVAACLHWGVRRGEEYVDPLSLTGEVGEYRLKPWGGGPWGGDPSEGGP